MPNNDLADALAAESQAFAERCEQLVHEHLRTTIREALSGGILDLPSTTSNGATAKAKPAPKPRKPRKVAKRKKGQKRTPDEIAALKSDLLAFFRKNPNSRSEDAKHALGLDASDMKLPIGQLCAEGRLAWRGERRATRYRVK